MVRTTTRPPESLVLTPDLDGEIIDPRAVSGFEHVGEFKPAEMLALMGIRVELVKERWLVTSVEPLGAGRRSGILMGDVIEAIDGVVLGRDTLFKGKVNVRSVQISRDGESLTIVF